MQREVNGIICKAMELLERGEKRETLTELRRTEMVLL